MLRGTRVVLPLGATGAVSGDIGTVSSRKCNGWLRVSIDGPTKLRTVVSVRNISDVVVTYDKWIITHGAPVKDPKTIENERVRAIEAEIAVIMRELHELRKDKLLHPFHPQNHDNKTIKNNLIH